VKDPDAVGHSGDAGEDHRALKDGNEQVQWA
jgi:hypothetical protein